MRYEEERDERAGRGLLLPPHEVRNQRLRLAAEMLALALRETAGLPVRQQTQVREAMKALTSVTQWCEHHARDGSYTTHS
jgi:hypothetical protein